METSGNRVYPVTACIWLGGNDYFIEGTDESADCGLSLRWVGDNNRGSGYMEKAMVAENIFEELDSPGEWFYDRNRAGCNRRADSC